MLNLEQSMVLDALQRQGRDTPYVNNRGDGNLYNDKTGMPLSRAEAYGSDARYNQLQNFPRNSNLPMAAMGGGYDTEDYIEQLMYGKPNNIMDMDAVRQIAGNGMSLNDVLANQFGSMTRYNQLQNYPNNTIDYTPQEAAQMRPNNIDDVLFYMGGGNIPQDNYRQPQAKGPGRQQVMSLQEYQDNYYPEYGWNYQQIPQEELRR